MTVDELLERNMELAEALAKERYAHNKLKEWLDKHTTFYNVEAPVVEGPNVPTLATE